MGDWPIRVVVFDFDGTLVDSNEIKRRGFFRLAERYPGGHEEMLNLLKIGGDRYTVLFEFAARMAKRRIILKGDEMVASYGAEVDGAVAAAPEMPGATSVLANLRRLGMRLHVNSATPHENLLKVMEARGWTDRFDGIQGGPAVKADTLKSICIQEGVRPDEIAVVGDGDDDAASAKVVGCTFVAVGSRLAAISLEDAMHVIVAKIGRSPGCLKCVSPE
jgi:phosphoglycolate phosphatase-like HAD superfamily hydrolase